MRRTMGTKTLLTLTLLVMVPGADFLIAKDRSSWPHELVVGSLRVHADFPLRDHVELLSGIASLQSTLQKRLGVQPGNEWVHVYFFRDKSTYQRYVQRYVPQAPLRRALFVKRKGPGMVFAYAGRDCETDLRHEATHALLHASLPMVPLWLDEGLAEYFELEPNRRVGGNPYLARMRRSLWPGQFSRLQKLEVVDGVESMDAADYRRSWAWVHFMLHGPPAAREELIGFLEDINAHSPPGQLSERLSRRIPDLERSFVTHFGTWRPN